MVAGMPGARRVKKGSSAGGTDVGTTGVPLALPVFSPPRDELPSWRRAGSTGLSLGEHVALRHCRPVKPDLRELEAIMKILFP